MNCANTFDKNKNNLEKKKSRRYSFLFCILCSLVLLLSCLWGFRFLKVHLSELYLQVHNFLFSFNFPHKSNVFDRNS